MTEDIVKAGSKQVNDVRSINKGLTEKTLRMRCLAYMHQVKSKLLIETIYDMTFARKRLANLNVELERSRHIVSVQNLQLQEQNSVLEMDRNLLELKVEERVKAYDYLVHYDPLTSLPNRFLFNDRLRHALTRADREKGKVGLLLIDLDHFRNVNDSAGHPAGDGLLVKVAMRIKNSVRIDDTVARLGGDEFAVILESLDVEVLAATVARKIRKAMLLPFKINNDTIYLTVSIGISDYPTDAGDPVALLKNADAAMYKSKSLGRNQYQFYTEDLTASAQSRCSLEAQLREALPNGEFELLYQPQFSFHSGEVTGAEALIRWNHPERGTILPNEFIWLAEETGFILELGEWILRQACRQVVQWLDEGRSVGRISVNLSAVQFAQPDIVETVGRILEQARCDGKYLELEMTESILITHPDEVVRKIEAFKSKGISLAIDDFGTGYSSLAYLKRFQVDWLKIDQTFICDVAAADDDSSAIIRAIIEMGHALNMAVIAEGVETNQQAEMLRLEGCDEMQGYICGKPMSARRVAELLIRYDEGEKPSA